MNGKLGVGGKGRM